MRTARFSGRATSSCLVGLLFCHSKNQTIKPSTRDYISISNQKALENDWRLNPVLNTPVPNVCKTVSFTQRQKKVLLYFLLTLPDQIGEWARSCSLFRTSKRDSSWEVPSKLFKSLACRVVVIYCNRQKYPLFLYALEAIEEKFILIYGK